MPILAIQHRFLSECGAKALVCVDVAVERQEFQSVIQALMSAAVSAVQVVEGLVADQLGGEIKINGFESNSCCAAFIYHRWFCELQPGYRRRSPDGNRWWLW